MIHEIIHLKAHFPVLGEHNCDPTLTVYAQDMDPQINRKDKLLPAILVCPGGGYRYVSPREAEPMAMKFMPWGFHVFVLTYSVAPNHFPTQIREVAAAMELIHANAEKWGVDTNRIAIMGFSAGGHLACHYSNCFDCPEVREVFPDSKPVNACVLTYPVITADPRYHHGDSIRCVSGHSEPTAEDVEYFSLNNRVTPRTPPTFLWHTAADELVPVMNSLLYAQALAENKVSFALRIYPHGAHGLATADDQTCTTLKPPASEAHAWIADAAKWLKSTI
ncbi:MAG: alpha/beta hydrolase [Ruminococcaceae bacterium]|nr:alpha/beta hydrolase [Oscillospiraceae bacterium]